jgi:hypothetical protein
MTEFVPTAKGTNFRFPSTANLYIDSLDRTSGSSSNFIINKPQNILTGFFTRLAVTEVIFDYCIPNVRAVDGNNTLTVDFGVGNVIITLPDDFYTVKSLLDTFISLLNTSIGAGTQFAIVPATSGDGVFIRYGDGSQGNYTFVASTLLTQLNIADAFTGTPSKLVECPAILNSKYFDIVSQNLTYCQDLKDASTSTDTRDVLFRWFLAWDNEGQYDAYGYPIFQGYRPFIQRRSISFPKQIKWDNIQPIGQLGFQIYNSDGSLTDTTTSGELEFNMTLLVSEV